MNTTDDDRADRFVSDPDDFVVVRPEDQQQLPEETQSPR